MNELKAKAAVQMAAGAVIVALCGTCTLHFETTTNIDDRRWAGVALIVGGIPTAIGLATFVWGLTRWLRPEPPAGGGDNE